MSLLAPTRSRRNDQRPSEDSALATGQLHFSDLALILLGSVVFTVLLFALTGFGGRAGFLIVLVIVYSIAQTTASFAREGRRQAADRLLTLGIRIAVGAALLPLVLVLGYTVYRGISKINGDFLTHSMKGIGPLDKNGGIYHAVIGTLEQGLLPAL